MNPGGNGSGSGSDTGGGSSSGSGNGLSDNQDAGSKKSLTLCLMFMQNFAANLDARSGLDLTNLWGDQPNSVALTQE